MVITMTSNTSSSSSSSRFFINKPRQMQSPFTMEKLYNRYHIVTKCSKKSANTYKRITHTIYVHLHAFVLAIKLHSPEKPSLIFVSSRRQTRLTALDLIAFLAVDDNPKQWLHMPESEVCCSWNSLLACSWNCFYIFLCVVVLYCLSKST